jgi:DNA polymerase-3 subunit delta
MSVERAKAVESAYLLLGPEIGEKNSFIDDIRAAIAKERGAPAEEERRYLPETRPAELVASMRNGSLFADHRLVIYGGLEQLSGKTDAAPLAEYLASPSPGVTLIMASDAVGVEKSLKDAAGEKRTKVFWELFENRKEEWIRAYFRKAGFRVSEGAVQALLDLVENNTEALKAECSRIALFQKPGTEIEESTIDAYVSHNRSEDAFSLFARMAQSGLTESLETLEKILDSKEGEPIGILAGLSWCFQRLDAYHAALASGLSPEEAFQRSNLRSKKQQQLYRDAAKRFPPGHCARTLSRIVDADAALRGAQSGAEALTLQVLVYEAMKKAGEPIAAMDHFLL